LQTSGMTVNLAMKYRNPVPTGDGVQIEIRGRIREMKRNFAVIDASLSHDGKICSTCEMTYFCFTQEKARSDFFFTGCETEE
ncbi:MAG: PaaI family thioesterase, partial [Bacteroidales bacterium]|nr:PaaI family thioesterase [Bacteroidales bacterium]